FMPASPTPEPAGADRAVLESPDGPDHPGHAARDESLPLGRFDALRRGWMAGDERHDALNG
ncbi:MAG: hypothetical protein K8E66_06895, partial [Phycisphaerales bacterium]|nr:hypothetical protein [Phycisphaerales bacterium]